MFCSPPAVGSCLGVGSLATPLAVKAHATLSLLLSPSLSPFASLWWPDPATTQRLGGSSRKPRFRPCLMLATGSPMTTPKTSWMLSPASWLKKELPERAARGLQAWDLCHLSLASAQKNSGALTERVQGYRGGLTL